MSKKHTEIISDPDAISNLQEIPAAFISEAVKELDTSDIPGEIITDAKKIADRVEYNNKLSGKNPKVLAVSCIYLSRLLNWEYPTGDNPKLTYGDLENMFGVTHNSTRRNMKLIDRILSGREGADELHSRNSDENSEDEMEEEQQQHGEDADWMLDFAEAVNSPKVPDDAAEQLSDLRDEYSGNEDGNDDIPPFMKHENTAFIGPNGTRR